MASKWNARNIFVATAITVLVILVICFEIHTARMSKEHQQHWLMPQEVKLWNSQLLKAYPNGSDFQQIKTYLKSQDYEEYGCSGVKSSQDNARTCFRSWIHDEAGAGYNSIDVKYDNNGKILELKAELGPHFLVY